MSKSKKWCYTLNNYENETQSEILNEHAVYHIYGREIGESGTPHLQGFVYFRDRKMLTALKKLLPTAHFEVAKGSIDSNYKYCTKDQQFVEYGERPPEAGVAGAQETKRRHAEIIKLASDGEIDSIKELYPTEFLRYHQTIKRIRQDHPRSYEPLPECSGEWYTGLSGSGKSRYVRDKYKDSLYKKLCNKWWDGYADQDFVLIEDVDKNHACLGHHFKIWADEYDFPAEVKGTTIVIRPKKIIVTSQYDIHDIWEDIETKTALQRRFKQFTVSNRKVYPQYPGATPRV